MIRTGSSRRAEATQVLADPDGVATVVDGGRSEPGGDTVSGTGRGAMARNASHLALGQIGTTVLAVVFSAALGRALGARDFGLYFLVTSMSTFGYVFVEWGQQPLVVREAARSPQRAGELLGTALALRVGAAVVVLGPLFLVAHLLAYDVKTRWLLVLYFAATFPVFLAQGFGMVFRARDRMDRDAIISVLNRAVGLAIVLVVLARGGGLVSIALAQLAAGILSLIVAGRFYQRLGAPRLFVTGRMVRMLLTDGVPIVAMVAASAVQPYIDAIILSKLVPADAMGWYGVAKNILGTLLAPAVILGTASYPQLSRAAGDPERFHEELAVALKPMLLLGALGAAGTYLFGSVAVQVIYGRSGYGPAVTIMQAFSPGMFLLFVDVLLGYALLAAGRARTFTIAKVTSVAVSTILDYLLIPYFQHRYSNGGIGVVVSFAASELVVFGSCVATMARGVLGVRFAIDSIKAVAAAGMTIVCIGAVSGIPPLAGIPLAIAIFGLTAVALRLIDRSDLALLTTIVRRRRSAQPSVQP